MSAVEQPSGLVDPLPANLPRRNDLMRIDEVTAEDPLTPRTPSDEQMVEIQAMDDNELQQELERQEALLRRQQNIQRLLYLRAGGTQTIDERAAELARMNALPTSYESPGAHKRNASSGAARNAKLV